VTFDAPLGLAFAAGLVATVNPCGFAMLPAYLSYFVGFDTAADVETPGAAPARRSNVGRALKVGALVSSGFVVVFGAAGLLIDAGARVVIDWIPYAAVVVGVAMVLLGIALFRGRELSFGRFAAGRGARNRDPRALFAFGVSYAVASLSCTLPVFLAVVVGSLASADVVSGVATYVAYALGMSVVLMSLTIAVALARRGLVDRLRSVLPYVPRISASLLVVAGAYITWFWIRDLSADAGEQGVAAGVVERWSASLTNWISDHSDRVGLALVGVVVLAAVHTVLKRFEPEPADDTGRVADPHPASEGAAR
jgi:cytochrome c biogenesis protein CcdA